MRRVLVLPLYPQYAASTTASALDQVFNAARKLRRMQHCAWSTPIDDPGYIKALAEGIGDYWMKNGRPTSWCCSTACPRRSPSLATLITIAETGRLLAEELGLGREQYVVTFQSRFGRAAARQHPIYPADAGRVGQRRHAPGRRRLPRLRKRLPRDSSKKQEGRAAFLKAGGHELPACLNERPAITALTDLAMRNLADGLIPTGCRRVRKTLARARAIGASL
jgi:ferrochelatase